MHVYAQRYGPGVRFLSFPGLPSGRTREGELAQLARASALQAEGQGFEPPILQDKIFET